MRPIRLKVRRSDQVIERTLVLAKFPVDGEIIATNRPTPWRGLRVDYMTQRNFRAVGMEFEDVTVGGGRRHRGRGGSPAASAGLKKGQLIRRVGDAARADPRAFAEAVANQDGPVTLETDRGSVTVGQ